MNKRGFMILTVQFDEGAILKSWGVDELFYLRNLQNRKVVPYWKILMIVLLIVSCSTYSSV